jgi:hypothetical protein
MGIHGIVFFTSVFFLNFFLRIFLKEIYVEDLKKYIPTGSATFNTSANSYQLVLDLEEDIGDVEITYEISATGNKGFALKFNKYSDLSVDDNVSAQVDGAGYFGSYTKISGNQRYTLYDTMYAANNWFKVTIRYVNQQITVTHNGKTHTDDRTFSCRYLTVVNWNSSKTINYRNLKVKAL